MEEEKGKNDNPLDHVNCQNLNDADPLHQDQYLFNLKVASCNTGENLLKDTCGFTDEPESELDTEHSAPGGMGTPVAEEQCPSKLSPFIKRRPSLVFSSPSPRSQTSSSNNETLKSSTGKELREEGHRSLPRPWYLPHTGQRIFNYSTPVGTNQSAFSQAINPSDADLSTASQSQACTDLETVTHRYRDDYRSYYPQLQGGITYPPYPYRDQSEEDDGISLINELDTEHSAQGGMGTPVAGEQYSSQMSPYFKRSSWDFFSRPSVSQTSSSNNETLKSSTGKELREEGRCSLCRPWYLPHTGQRIFNSSTPVISNQSASSQAINPSDADLSTASQSQACTDLETLTHRYRDDYRSYSLQLPGEMTHLLYRTATDACASGSQSRGPPVAGPPCPQGRPTVIQNSTDCIAGSGAQEAFHLLSVESESEPGGGGGVLLEMDAPVTASNYSATTTLQEHGLLPPPRSRSDSSCLSRSSSMPSLSGITSVENKSLRRAESSPDMLLRSSFEDFTPDIAEDENDETYRFQCSCAGLYLCSVTGLLFHMAGEGDVVYRTVPWDWRLLARHHKKPAGPLFNIKCEQQSVRGLHLPHCEIRSTGGCDFLSVAHVKDEGVEFIDPQEITETHVLISITGFSAFGNVKDEDSPPVPVRAQVLLFYRPPADPDPESLLNVLLLPRNVVLRDVLRIRKKLFPHESYIEVPPNCKLTPEQEYTLSTLPEDDQVEVQPRKAEFDCEDYGNYSSSFQVTWETTLNRIMLLLRDANNSHGVWEGRVCLSSAGARRCCGPSAPDLPSTERLLAIRSRFIESISGPVLKSLLDKLFEKKVMNETERESADEMPNNRDKARFVIDTVRKKGEVASSEMIKFFCEADPFLCEHLGLI